MSRIGWLVGAATLLAPTVVHAEVMDKEPSLASMWLLGATAALTGLAVCRRRPALGIWTLALTGVVFWVRAIGELWDPHVGPAIRHEAPGYATGVYLAAALAVAGHLAGTLWNRRAPR